MGVVACCLGVVRTPRVQGWVRSSGGRGRDRQGFSEQVAVLTLLSRPVFSHGWWHVAGRDGEASDWTKGDDDKQRSSMMKFYSSNVL